MLRHPGRDRAARSRRSTRCATLAASETRYDADPQDLIDAVVALRERGRRDPGDLPLAPALGGRPQPDRPAREPLRRRAPDHRLAARPIRPTSGSGGSTPTRTRSSPGGSSSPTEARRCVEPGRLTAKLPLVIGPRLRLEARDFGHRRLRRKTSSSMQRTLIIFKPDCVQRRLVGPDPRAVRGQGPADRRAQADPGRPRAGREALRRAPGQAVLRRADRVHHRRPGGRRRARGERGDRGRPRPCWARPTASPPRRARSAATSRSASRTTWSTAATAPSRPSARSPSGSGPRSWSTTSSPAASGSSAAPESP